MFLRSANNDAIPFAQIRSTHNGKHFPIPSIPRLNQNRQFLKINFRASLFVYANITINTK
jgi:hypothetical protein